MSFGGFVLVVEPVDLRAVKQQVGILRKLREPLREDASRVAEPAALDEIERLLCVQVGTRGLISHALMMLEKPGNKRGICGEPAGVAAMPGIQPGTSFAPDTRADGKIADA